MKLALALYVSFLALAFAGCGGGGSSAPTEDTQAEAAAFDLGVINGALQKLNNGGRGGMVSIVVSPATSSVQTGGTYRCSVAFSADFPDQVLVSVVGSNGSWAQINVDPQTGVDIGSLNTGTDFRAAGFDDAFWQNGHDCSVRGWGVYVP